MAAAVERFFERLSAAYDRGLRRALRHPGWQRQQAEDQLRRDRALEASIRDEYLDLTGQRPPPPPPVVAPKPEPKPEPPPPPKAEPKSEPKPDIALEKAREEKERKAREEAERAEKRRQELEAQRLVADACGAGRHRHQRVPGHAGAPAVASDPAAVARAAGGAAFSPR